MHVTNSLKPWRRWVPATMLALLVCGVVAVPHVQGQTSPPRASTEPAAESLCGRLTETKGVRVLQLWGTPQQQGYAHGYLLADQIVRLVDEVLLDPRVMPNAQTYETMIRGSVVRMFAIDAAVRSELDGMLEGVHARMGLDGAQLDRLDRPMDVTDLVAINTLADWNPSACTSLAVWDADDPGGATLVGRNLDYFNLPGINQLHLVIARTESSPETKHWVSIAWPGIIGAYTAINEARVFVSMHDVPAPKATGATGLTPRSLVLRKIVEQADADNAIDTAHKLLRDHPTFRGNNVLVAAPFTGQSTPTAVFEYDGDKSKNEGVTARLPRLINSEAGYRYIACTNHYRLRTPPKGSCQRYETVSEALAGWKTARWRNPEVIRRIIAQAAMDITVHSVTARLDTGQVWLSFASASSHACQNKPVAFKLSEFWKSPAAGHSQLP